MRLRHTPALLAFFGTLGALNCSDPGSSDSSLLVELERIWAPSESVQTDLTPENCRNVALQRTVRFGEASGEASCQFDASTAQLSCRTALGRTGEVTTNEFASLSDFIEAGHSPGKVTSLSEVRTLGRREIVTRHEYDELGRLILRREARPEGDIVYTYADFDESGRPRSAQPTPVTLEQWGCSVAPMTIEYGDVRVRYQYRPAAGCSQSDYSIVERFDVSGNLVQIERFSPAGVETLFEASAPAATQLLCD
ncbi:MAG: hypothetical protein RL033_2557 [Pseudomonadota bacterium]|jgi:hypothetical protein